MLTLRRSVLARPFSVFSGQFPWLADIQVIDTGQSKCGGSLIDANWLITAAHCLTTIQPEDLRVRKTRSTVVLVFPFLRKPLIRVLL